MPRAPRVGIVSLGCPKALVDVERILNQMRAEGYVTVPDYKSADLVLINSCGFIDSAKEETIQTISEALEQNGRVIVTGCMGVNPSDIQKIHPSVLAVIGPHDTKGAMDAVHKWLPPLHDPKFDLVPPAGIKLTPSHYAYLKISEGCNNSCSFCIIPSFRGRLVSRDAAKILYEAERLVDHGVKELLVISQDTGAYGLDIKYASSRYHGEEVRAHILDLAKGLGKLDAWVRLHYVYPYKHIDDLIPLMEDGVILPYLDVPFQHASPRVLKAMRRPADQLRTLERVQNWRKICPSLTLRSTFIVGFPSETEAEFQELLTWLTEAELDRVGAFAFEPVEGAEANKIEGHLPKELREERLQRLMEHQANISKKRLARLVGQEVAVILDHIAEDGSSIGRTSGDAPEIDGIIKLDALNNPKNLLKIGDLVAAKVTSSDDHDLSGIITQY